MDLSSEQRRRQNIADNKRILAEIGLINPFKETPRLVLKKSGLKRKAENDLPRQRKRPLLEENVDHSNRGSVMGKRRRSARLQGDKSGEGLQFMQLEDDDDDEEVENKTVRVEKNRPNHYGAIPGVEVGASWYTRMECCRDGIHRPTVAGIHAGAEGAYSIALSGGYDDNVDYGECFTYTGEGGRDLKGTKTNPKNLRTAPQSKNQTLTRGNLALSRNVETGNPVRVIRGYKLTSPFAPEEGYRYDGLYTVEKAWYTGGMSGFMVWKFALKRCKDQASPVWEFTEELKVSDTDKSKEIDQDEENHELDQKIEARDSDEGETDEESLAETSGKASENKENDAVCQDKTKKNDESDDEETDENQEEKTGNNLEEKEKPRETIVESETVDKYDEKDQKTEEQDHAANEDGKREKAGISSKENEIHGKAIANSEVLDMGNGKEQHKSEEEHAANEEVEKAENSILGNEKVELKLASSDEVDTIKNDEKCEN